MITAKINLASFTAIDPHALETSAALTVESAALGTTKAWIGLRSILEIFSLTCRAISARIAKIAAQLGACMDMSSVCFRPDFFMVNVLSNRDARWKN